MTDYHKYINSLRKCEKEHENDTTSIGHIIVSDLCRDMANLLEELEQEPTTKNNIPHCQCTDEEIAKSFIEDVEAVKDQLPCGEQMDFPSTFDEFAKDYGFKDKDEIYTNGSELIPVFRVKQWLEHISTTKNDLGVREFEGLEVTYPPENICIYPEYKGKPYFGIQYRENGESIVGYGTYSPQVLSRYLKDYFIPTTKNNNLGVDCISRDDVWDVMQELWRTSGELIDRLMSLPSVTPQEPKTGHWMGDSYGYICSNCEHELNDLAQSMDYICFRKPKYCPNCGCAMVEPKESEE